MKQNARMGLIDRIFKNSPAGKDEKKSAPASQTQSSTQFFEDDPDAGDTQTGRNAPRRELVQVILRDTMRRHGIPSDWIECRILSAVTRTGRRGLHVLRRYREVGHDLVRAGDAGGRDEPRA